MILVDEVNNNTNLVITIVVVIGIILLIVLVLGLIFYPIIKRQYMYRNFRLVYYKKIYSIAEKNDYFFYGCFYDDDIKCICFAVS